MPMRVGFTEFRKQMLERELGGIQDLLPNLGVEKVILTGDMVTEDYSPDSSIDLIVVHKTDATFGRRADFFSYHLGVTWQSIPRFIPRKSSPPCKTLCRRSTPRAKKDG